MFIDAREVNNTDGFVTTICIIGGGMAGITLALELAKHQIDVCLLESGGLTSDPATDDLYQGENVGIPYGFDCNFRSRYLGGSSNCWYGWNRPFETEDFRSRAWVPHSGWPLSYEDLKPYYDRTHSLLLLGPTNFDSEFWEAAVNHPQVRRVRFASSRVRDSFTQFSPPVRMGTMHHAELAASRYIRTILHANATNIASDSTAHSVTHIDVKTLNGRRFSVAADYFVLATGGIENARLLLASNQTQHEGLGNSNDLVGRFFMDHPRQQTGRIKLRKAYRDNKLYDIKYQDNSRLISAHSTSVAAQFVLAPEVIKQEQLLHARVWFRSTIFGEGTEAVLALRRFTQTFLHKKDVKLQWRRDLRLIMRDPLKVLGYALSRAFPERLMIHRIRYEIVVEPDPNPNSRVTLAEECDALGMRRARVDWQLGPLVQKTFTRTLEIVTEELQRAGVADIELPTFVPAPQWSTDLFGTWHHMGTTRMHDSPQQGVVDRNCRVHGIDNLFIAGSSVFPTGGGNFPTMTLTALALRLADHLAKRPTPPP